MFRRPNLYTSYEDEAQIFPTVTQKVFAAIGVLLLLLVPFQIAMVTADTGILSGLTAEDVEMLLS